MKKITISEVFKQDLQVIMYLFVFGGITILSRYLKADENLSILFGAIADYAVYRVKQELDKTGYIKAIKG